MDTNRYKVNFMLMMMAAFHIGLLLGAAALLVAAGDIEARERLREI